MGPEGVDGAGAMCSEAGGAVGDVNSGLVRIGVEAGRGVTAGSGLEGVTGTGVGAEAGAGAGAEAAGSVEPGPSLETGASVRAAASAGAGAWAGAGRTACPHDWQLVCPRKIRRAPQWLQTGAGSVI